MNAYFHVYKTGKLTVVGFEARHLADPQCQDACRDELQYLTQSHGCKILVVDLMEVSAVNSWVLGILAALQKRGVEVELYHPSPEIRKILVTTHMGDHLHVRHDTQR